VRYPHEKVGRITGLFQRISDYYWKRIFDRRGINQRKSAEMQLKVLKQEYGAKLFEIPKGEQLNLVPYGIMLEEQNSLMEVIG
jgi:hypothetical protein